MDATVLALSFFGGNKEAGGVREEKACIITGREL
jgi:hypothetical protein